MGLKQAAKNTVSPAFRRQQRKWKWTKSKVAMILQQARRAVAGPPGSRDAALLPKDVSQTSQCRNRAGSSRLHGPTRVVTFPGTILSLRDFSIAIKSPGKGTSFEIQQKRGFPGGGLVDNLPANAGDTGSSPGLGRIHMPRSNWAREPQLLGLRLWSLCSATREAAILRGLRTAMKSGPHLP